MKLERGGGEVIIGNALTAFTAFVLIKIIFIKRHELLRSHFNFSKTGVRDFENSESLQRHLNIIKTAGGTKMSF